MYDSGWLRTSHYPHPTVWHHYRLLPGYRRTISVGDRICVGASLWLAAMSALEFVVSGGSFPLLVALVFPWTAYWAWDLPTYERWQIDLDSIPTLSSDTLAALRALPDAPAPTLPPAAPARPTPHEAGA